MLGEPEILACCDRCGLRQRTAGYDCHGGGGWDDRNVEGN